MKISVAEAESKFPELLRAVEGGETVTICREGVAVAEVVQAKDTTAVRARGPRRLGTLKGKVVEIDPNWWKAMSDAEVDDFLSGNY